MASEHHPPRDTNAPPMTGSFLSNRLGTWTPSTQTRKRAAPGQVERGPKCDLHPGGTGISLETMANGASWAEGLRGRAPAPTRTRGDCWPLPFSCVQIPRKRLGKARESPGQPQPWSRGWAPGKIHTCELSPNEKHGGFSILTQWFTREQHKTKCPVPSWDHLHSEGTFHWLPIYL